MIFLNKNQSETVQVLIGTNPGVKPGSGPHLQMHLYVDFPSYSSSSSFSSPSSSSSSHCNFFQAVSVFSERVSTGRRSEFPLGGAQRSSSLIWTKPLHSPPQPCLLRWCAGFNRLWSYLLQLSSQETNRPSFFSQAVTQKSETMPSGPQNTPRLLHHH